MHSIGPPGTYVSPSTLLGHYRQRNKPSNRRLIQPHHNKSLTHEVRPFVFLCAIGLPGRVNALAVCWICDEINSWAFGLTVMWAEYPLLHLRAAPAESSRRRESSMNGIS